MTDISTIPTFLDALRAALVLRAGLAGVNVFTAGVDDQSAGLEAVVFCVDPVEAEGEWPTAGKGRCSEEYEVPGKTVVVKDGAGETAIKTARDRAFEILEEVIDQLQVSVTTSAAMESGLGGIRNAEVTRLKLTQSVLPNQRVADLEFVLSVRANFTPT